MNKHLFDKTDEIELFARIRANPDDSMAKSRIIERYLPFIANITRQFMRERHISPNKFEEYFQEAIIGAYATFKNFELERGSFATYSGYYIRQQLREYMNAEVNPLSGRRLQLVHRARVVNHAIAKYVRKYGRKPTIRQLSELTGLSEHHIQDESLFAGMSYQSLNDDSGVSPGFASNRIPDASIASPDFHLLVQEEYDACARYINEVIEYVRTRFKTRDADIFFRRHGIHVYAEVQTLEEVSLVYDVSRERIRQIVEEIWRRMARRSKMYTSRKLRIARYAITYLPELMQKS